jgi:hypothetical protein
VLLLLYGGGKGGREDVEMLLSSKSSQPHQHSAVIFQRLCFRQRNGDVVCFIECDIICSYYYSYQIFAISNIPISKRTLLPAPLARIVYMSIWPCS